jgi:tetratricopeptide (TPR) repeat protein
MKRIIFIIIIVLISLNIFAQNAKKLNRQGFKLYNDTSFSEAEKRFRSALEVDSLSFTYNYNLADALYKEGQFTAAEEKLKSLTENTNENEKLANIYHNLGNSQLKQVETKIAEQDLEGAISKTEESIESYKNSMRINPEDKETKYNYLVAKKLLEQLQQQQQQEQQNQEKEQEKKEQDSQEKQQDGQNQDTDQDGMTDQTEKEGQQSNPPDTDKDGAPDYNDFDSDNDGLPDSYEAGQNPEQPQDTDNDGTPDYQDLDSNNDGKPDSEEAQKMYQISKEDAMRILEAIDKADQITKDKVIEDAKVNKKDKDKDW